MTIMNICYYILEVVILCLALIGTWEIAQATVAREDLFTNIKNNKADEQYKPIFALNPIHLLNMVRWLFKWNSDKRGAVNLLILRKRFAWGLRYLMLSIFFNYILDKLKPLFF